MSGEGPVPGTAPEEEPPKPFDASDKNSVEKRNKDLKRQGSKRQAGLKELCNSPNGRAWLWGLLEDCGFSRTSFSAEHGRMAFNEGQRNVALKVMADVNRVAPDTYLKMQRENAGDE